MFGLMTRFRIPRMLAFRGSSAVGLSARSTSEDGEDRDRPSSGYHFNCHTSTQSPTRAVTSKHCFLLVSRVTPSMRWVNSVKLFDSVDSVEALAPSYSLSVSSPESHRKFPSYRPEDVAGLVQLPVEHIMRQAEGPGLWGGRKRRDVYG